ncbi:DUF1351 domain-containing protein [Lactococcus insecticola]|uniref:DUF1351 domain-containing protein n=1 Tax=Pseudolactococcus insecticola TaxID=2709158 RepID=A0A6A0B5N8_9LACT|nr:DUF1351 domain-containing protein [Lactococcus insecticola]GFH39828.1 hypothetical protein Hs20B_02260 [Lactococcus insecticola]
MITDLNVTLTPAIISIGDRDKFEKTINEIVSNYKGYTPSIDNLKADKATRATINKLIKSIDDRRKDIKKDYEQPLDEFQDWLKKAVESLVNVKLTIDVGIKEIEANERALRADSARVVLENMAIDAGFQKDSLAVKDEMLVKANFTDDYKPKKSLIDELDYMVQNAVEARNARDKNLSSIATMAEMNGLSTEPYVRALNSGSDIAEILQAMNADAHAQKEREERLAQQQKEFETKKLEESFNPAEKATESPVRPVAEKVVNNPYPAMLSITVDIESFERKEQFKQWMTENNYTWQVKDFKSK